MNFQAIFSGNLPQKDKSLLKSLEEQAQLEELNDLIGKYTKILNAKF